MAGSSPTHELLYGNHRRRWSSTTSYSGRASEPGGPLGRRRAVHECYHGLDCLGRSLDHGMFYDSLASYYSSAASLSYDEKLRSFESQDGFKGPLPQRPFSFKMVICSNILTAPTSIKRRRGGHAQAVGVYNGFMLLRRQILYMLSFPSADPECFGCMLLITLASSLPSHAYSHIAIIHTNPMLRAQCMTQSQRENVVQPELAWTGPVCGILRRTPHSRYDRYTTSHCRQQKNPGSAFSLAERPIAPKPADPRKRRTRLTAPDWWQAQKRGNRKSTMPA